MKRLLMIVLTLTLVFAGASVANAQDESPSTEPDRRPAINPDGEIVEILSAATGLEPQAMRERLQEDGVTLAALITENGGDVDAVAAQLVTLMQARLEAQLAERSAQVEERVADMLNGEGRFGERRPGLGERGEQATQRAVAGRAVQLITENSDLTARDVMGSLREGQTLAQVATDAGLNVDDLAASLVSSLEERVNTALANERITQERADELMAGFPEQIETLLNTPLDPNRPNLPNRPNAPGDDA